MKPVLNGLCPALSVFGDRSAFGLHVVQRFPIGAVRPIGQSGPDGFLVPGALGVCRNDRNSHAVVAVNAMIHLYDNPLLVIAIVVLDVFGAEFFP